MNMRRYSMKARRVTALKRLLRNDRVNVKRIAVAPHEKKEDSVYIFFDNVEEVEEVVAKEKEIVARLKKKAVDVAKDEVYAKLSNSKQRELYLLDHYGLLKREGVDVIELVKIAEVEASVAMDEKLLTAKVKLEVEEQIPILEKGMVKELTESQKALERERKENERIHKRDIKEKGGKKR